MSFPILFVSWTLPSKFEGLPNKSGGIEGYIGYIVIYIYRVWAGKNNPAGKGGR